MPLVDFDTLSDELGSAEYMRVMYALVRTTLAHGADNLPAMLILSDDALFWGGSEAEEGKFHRVPLKSITGSAKVGRLLWECVELKHMELEGEKTIYLCPFTGPPQNPRKDSQSMEELLSHVQGR